MYETIYDKVLDMVHELRSAVEEMQPGGGGGGLGYAMQTNPLLGLIKGQMEEEQKRKERKEEKVERVEYAKSEAKRLQAIEERKAGLRD